MIIMGEIIREISGKTLDLYAIENFYKPLGANRTFFNPLKFLLMNEIIPTENDKTFRKQQLQGYVHDQASAMLGGVAGHAGLFSNANDLGKILQMLLQGGTYGAVRYFSEETVKYFTSAHFLANGNRRGLGFETNRLSLIREQVLYVHQHRPTVLDTAVLPVLMCGLTPMKIWFSCSCVTGCTRWPKTIKSYL